MKFNYDNAGIVFWTENTLGLAMWSMARLYIGNQFSYKESNCKSEIEASIKSLLIKALEDFFLVTY